MKILVAGTGPAGMFAAWGVASRGHEVVLASPKLNQPDGQYNAGVFFLDKRMDLPLDPFEVEGFAFGAHPTELAERYAQKVYGDLLGSGEVSLNEHIGVSTGYSADQAIKFIWDILKPGQYHGTRHVVANFEHFEQLEPFADTVECDLVISTAPLNKLFPERFAEQFPLVYAHIHTSSAPADESYMMYNASRCIDWYRASAIQGVFTIEWPATAHTQRCTQLIPDGHRCTIVPKVAGPMTQHIVNRVSRRDRTMTTGRQGAWAKHKLATDAWDDAINFVDGAEAIL